MCDVEYLDQRKVGHTLYRRKKTTYTYRGGTRSGIKAGQGVRMGGDANGSSLNGICFNLLLLRLGFTMGRSRLKLEEVFKTIAQVGFTTGSSVGCDHPIFLLFIYNLGSFRHKLRLAQVARVI